MFTHRTIPARMALWARPLAEVGWNGPAEQGHGLSEHAIALKAQAGTRKMGGCGLRVMTGISVYSV